MLIAKELKSLIDLSLPKSISCLHVLSTMYSSTRPYMLCDYRAFMSTESCVKVLSAAGKPRHITLRQSRPYQPTAYFRFRLSLRVDPFLRWPALKSFSSAHRFQLRNKWKSYSSISPRVSHSSSQFCQRYWVRKLYYKCLLKKRSINFTEYGLSHKKSGFKSASLEIKKTSSLARFSPSIGSRFVVLGMPWHFMTRCTFTFRVEFFNLAFLLLGIDIVVLAIRQCAAWPSTLITHKHFPT